MFGQPLSIWKFNMLANPINKANSAYINYTPTINMAGNNNWCLYQLHANHALTDSKNNWCLMAYQIMYQERRPRLWYALFLKTVKQLVMGNKVISMKFERLILNAIHGELHESHMLKWDQSIILLQHNTSMPIITIKSNRTWNI